MISSSLICKIAGDGGSKVDTTDKSTCKYPAETLLFSSPTFSNTPHFLTNA